MREGRPQAILRSRSSRPADKADGRRPPQSGQGFILLGALRIRQVRSSPRSTGIGFPVPASLALRFLDLNFLGHRKNLLSPKNE